MSFQLLKCIAKAVAKHGGKFLSEVIPGADVVCEMAVDAYQDYCQHCEQGALRLEVQALAQSSPEQVRQEARVAVQAEGSHLPADMQRQMVAYLAQVPAMIRRSLRRPSDATGTTIPPSLTLSRPEDLLPFLPPRPPRFKPGDRPLPGVDWVLEEPLGVGGFGEVWKARHAHLTSKAPVALKFCLDASAVPVLRNEAGVLDQVMRHGRHVGIVPLLQTYLSAEPPCLEYEYVEGGDLAALIQELHERGKGITATANRMLLRLAEIVAFAHRANPPIVHGDLKPANVLVGRGEKGELLLRVTDFGIGGLAAVRAAREVRQPTRSRQTLLTEVVRGAYTPLYASPEQMARRPGQPADPRDDVHALGVIWYQLVTGDLGMLTVPTDWREQLEKRELPPPLVKLLASCIAPRADSRPASAAVLAEQLAPALGPTARPGAESRVQSAPPVAAGPTVVQRTPALAREDIPCVLPVVVPVRVERPPSERGREGPPVTPPPLPREQPRSGAPSRSGLVTAVAIVHFVASGLALLCGVVGFAYGSHPSNFYVPDTKKPAWDDKKPAWDDKKSGKFEMPAASERRGGKSVGVATMAVSALNVLWGLAVAVGGLGVLWRRRWGRLMGLILAGGAGVLVLAHLGLLAAAGFDSPAPVGLVFYLAYSGFVFWVLLFRPATRAEFV